MGFEYEEEVAAIKAELKNIGASLDSLSETTTQLRIAIESMIADGTISDTNLAVDCVDSQGL